MRQWAITQPTATTAQMVMKPTRTPMDHSLGLALCDGGGVPDGRGASLLGERLFLEGERVLLWVP
ncbi:hypothetical protein GCM10027030_21820 [Luteococcus sediminum]